MGILRWNGSHVQRANEWVPIKMGVSHVKINGSSIKKICSHMKISGARMKISGSHMHKEWMDLTWK